MVERTQPRVSASLLPDLEVLLISVTGKDPSHMPDGGPDCSSWVLPGTYTFTVKCLEASHSHKTQAIQTLTLTVNP